MNKNKLEEEIRRIELRIALLEDALMKFVTEITIEKMKVISPLSSPVRSYEDIQYLKMKRKYLRFLIWFLEKTKR